MKAEPKNKNHHRGKRTGYELINGEYHIAPYYYEQFNKLQHKRKGIETLLTIVNQHAAENLEEISRVNQAIFNDLADDIGLDLKEAWVHSHGIVKRQDSKELEKEG